MRTLHITLTDCQVALYHIQGGMPQHLLESKSFFRKLFENSGEQTCLRRFVYLNTKWARMDSNHRPHGCEPCALTS